MHLEQIRDKKHKLEKDIGNLLKAFTEETSIEVERVDVDNVRRFDSFTNYVNEVPNSYTVRPIATARLKIDL